ncbi:sensor histidine kinase [uncultured Metabacillus sp.]|uniref:cache domain-containing sensor histidine kinase n=1 Tax=uncultured Metabacillus sp. TaxID=2860135 RepID=UPI00260C0437|nr:sensor histidine kinase [uncultured Metabacillus sp.]
MQIKPFYDNFKIKDQIFSISLLLLLVFCLIGIIIFNFFSNMYIKKIYEESANIIQVSSTVLDKELTRMEKLSLQISTDNVVQDSLEQVNKYQLKYENYVTKSKLLNTLVNYATQEKYIASIQIIDQDGEKFTAGFNTKVENDAEKVLPIAVAAQGANVLTAMEDENRLMAARLIRKKENVELGTLGTLIITIDMNKLIQESLNFPSDNHFVIEKDGDVLYMSDFNKLDEIPKVESGSGYDFRQIDGKEYMVVYQTSKTSNLTYFNIIPFDNIMGDTKIIKLLMALCFLFMLALTIILSRRAAATISKPLEDLTEKMKQVQTEGFEHSAFKEVAYSNQEVGQLHRDFQSMMDQINELIKENYQKQLVIKETEYKALQSQMNPHFLYNTLDSINWAARINKQQKISTMTEALANMLRNIISKKEPLITIKDELQIVQDYITIQHYRYHDRLHFTLECPAEIEHVYIPKLSIQPIVENAIQHVLEEIDSECKIAVAIFTHDDETLQIVIEDNGPGMDDATIKAIFKGEIKPKGTGIGLRNINERMKLMFGEAYGLQLESERGNGTRVTITIPYKTG